MIASWPGAAGDGMAVDMAMRRWPPQVNVISFEHTLIDERRGRGTMVVGREVHWDVLILKYCLVFGYAILIRQLVICPCCVASAANDQDDMYSEDVTSERSRKVGCAASARRRSRVCA